MPNIDSGHSLINQWRALISGIERIKPEATLSRLTDQQISVDARSAKAIEARYAALALFRLLAVESVHASDEVLGPRSARSTARGDGAGW